MSFREILGLSIDSVEGGLSFKPEVIDSKPLISYSVNDVQDHLKENGSDKTSSVPYLLHYPDVKAVSDKPMWVDGIFDLFVLLPGFHGGEYTRTPGHYRNEAENGFCFPELYQVIEGYTEVLLQQPAETHEQVKDIILYRCNPRDIVVVPPSYAAIIINPTERKTVVARIRARDAKSLSEPFMNTKGPCYYRQKEGGWDYNVNYEEIPTLRLQPPPANWKIMRRGAPIYLVYTHNPYIVPTFVTPDPIEYII